MRKLTLTLALALAPALALAAPPAAPGGPGPGRGADTGRQEHMEKRMRLARTVGLADALDLDEAGALRARETLARFDERRAPLRAQRRESLRIVRDAAGGDAAAGAQLDQALGRLRDARDKLQQLDAEQLAQLTQGMQPQQKARAALFLARFRERAPHLMMRGGPGGPSGAGGPGHGPGHPGMMDHRSGMRGQGPGPAGMAEGHMALGGAPLDEEDGAFADE